MTKNLLLWAVVIFLFAGCGAVFTHPTKDRKALEREFERDRRDCERYVATHPRDVNATCKAPVLVTAEDSATGAYNAVFSDDDGTCATCEEVKRCLVERKGWKRVR